MYNYYAGLFEYDMLGPGFWAAYNSSIGFLLLIGVFSIVCLWKVFEKAGKPGWAAIIPFYNLWVLLEITNFSGSLLFLLLIPIVGLFALGVICIFAYARLAKLFGKDSGFAVGLALIPLIFLPIIAFDNSKYQKATK